MSVEWDAVADSYARLGRPKAFERSNIELGKIMNFRCKSTDKRATKKRQKSDKKAIKERQKSGKGATN